MKEVRAVKDFFDERVIKEQRKVISKMYQVIILNTIIETIIKMLFTREVNMYLLEISVIVISLLYVIMSYITNKIQIGKKDEYNFICKNKIYTNAYMISFSIYLIGELLFYFFCSNSIVYTLSYILVWAIPTIIITYKLYRKGLLIIGSKKRSAKWINRLKKEVFIYSIIFAIVIEVVRVSNNGCFKEVDILVFILVACGFGIPFFFLFKLIINGSEKKADNEIK